MPIKRRSTKAHKLVVTPAARAIWASGRQEMICLTQGGAGMVCCEKLAEELGLLPFIMTPNMAEVARMLSENLVISDGDKRHARPSKT
ncbi:hypothetical protein N9381_10065 [Paracoccaceae bacterium]|nr:hypothetical protein [Paracoccaceae bacterium]